MPVEETTLGEAPEEEGQSPPPVEGTTPPPVESAPASPTAPNLERIKRETKISLALSVLAFLLGVFNAWWNVSNTREQRRLDAYSKLKGATAIFQSMMTDSVNLRLQLTWTKPADRAELLKNLDVVNQRLIDNTRDMSEALARVEEEFKSNPKVLAMAQAAYDTLMGPGVRWPADIRSTSPETDFSIQLKTIVNELESELKIPQGKMSGEQLFPAFTKEMRDAQAMGACEQAAGPNGRCTKVNGKWVVVPGDPSPELGH